MGHIFFLSTDCKIIAGENGACIYDLRRQNYVTLDVEYANFLLDNNFESVKNLDELDKSFVNFLKNNEYIVIIPAEFKSNFPPLSNDFHTNSHLTGCIIEQPNIDQIGKIIDKIYIESLCENYTVHITEAVKSNSILRFLDLTSFYRIPSIDLVFHNSLINFNDGKEILMENVFVNSISCYNSDYDFFEIIRGELLMSCKSAFKDTFSISSKNFFVNIPFFTESLQFNTYFNRKIFVDSDGNIYPHKGSSLNKGHYSSVNVNDLINDKEFTKLWTVNKDKISQCCNCKYRYMCYDYRIPKFDREEGWVYNDSCEFYSK